MSRTRTRSKRLARLSAIPAVLIATGAAAVISASPAQAGVTCWAGIDSGTTNWAWGSCSGIYTNSWEMWRLHVSCTLGMHADSPWYADNRRVDVQCPWPSSVRTPQVVYYND